LQWLYTYVAGFYSQCFIYYFRHTLQVCLFDIPYVSHICCKYFSGCCVCFYNRFKYFSGVFTNVSDVCFKCFICFQTYVASVSSGCFKGKLGFTSPSSSLPPCLGVSSSSSQRRLGIHRPSPSSRCWWCSGRCGPCVGAGNELKTQTSGRSVYPDVRTLASPLFMCSQS
jgi:hypothetical protein